MDYNKMLQYVKKTLEDNNAIKPTNPNHQFRSRFEHTKRVLGWCKKLMVDLDCNEEILFTAAIFHDVGYSKGKVNHALASALLFKEYAKENSFDEKLINDVSYIISNHSDKSLLKENVPNEMIILLEADLMDEEGAMGIVWDLMAIGKENPESYDKALEACSMHSGHILNQDYMVTPLAKKYWDEKKELVRNFITSLSIELSV